MNKLVLFTALLLSTTLQADPRYYTEYKNNMTWFDNHYVDNTSVNNLRLGVADENLYIEAGGAEHNSEVGYSFEAGYKFKFENKYEMKGKVEAIDEGIDHHLPWKTEAEFRYYFN